MTDKSIAERQDTDLAISDIYSDAGGTGLEGIGIADLAIPYIAILQALSPQVKKGSPNRIAGAEEGDIYNNVSKQVWKGETGIVVIPCHYAKRYIEWVPREEGGGFVAPHDDESILKQCVRNDKNRDILPNGNEIVTTAYHSVVIVEWEGEDAELKLSRAVISMIRTQLKKSRAWNSQISGLQRVVNGKLVTPPSFASIYRLSTETEEKNGNSYFNWHIGPPSPVCSAVIARYAVDFFKALRSGEVQVKPEGDVNQAPSPKDETPF